MGTAEFFGVGLKGNPRHIPTPCEACPVRSECLDHGLRYEADGTWGGVPQADLRVMRRNLGIKLPRF